MQLDPVTIQILWNRMVSVVDEAASGLFRTAYTPSVKEYHDFAALCLTPRRVCLGIPRLQLPDSECGADSNGPFRGKASAGNAEARRR
jgi:N-methylhydantoinase B